MSSPPSVVAIRPPDDTRRCGQAPAQPSAAYASAARRRSQSASEDLVDLALRVLPADLEPEEDRLHAVRGLRSLVHGFVSIEAIRGFGLSLDLDGSFARAVAIFAAGLRALGGPTITVKDGATS